MQLLEGRSRTLDHLASGFLVSESCVEHSDASRAKRQRQGGAYAISPPHSNRSASLVEALLGQWEGGGHLGGKIVDRFIRGFTAAIDAVDVPATSRG